MDDEIKARDCPFCNTKPITYELSCGWYTECDNDLDCAFVPNISTSNNLALAGNIKKGDAPIFGLTFDDICLPMAMRT